MGNGAVGADNYSLEELNEAYDELITHDNTSEIREVQVAQREIVSLKNTALNELGRKILAEEASL